MLTTGFRHTHCMPLADVDLDDRTVETEGIITRFTHRQTAPPVATVLLSKNIHAFSCRYCSPVKKQAYYQSEIV